MFVFDLPKNHFNLAIVQSGHYYKIWKLLSYKVEIKIKYKRCS